MSRVERSALVQYSNQQMYDLVADFYAYPKFLPGCVGSELLAEGEGWLEARLDIAKAGFTQSFVTHNELDPPNGMTLELVKGPFKSLKGAWQFTALTESACKVNFWLEFEFANKMISLAAGKVFEKIASEQVDAMCKRAKVLYG